MSRDTPVNVTTAKIIASIHMDKATGGHPKPEGGPGSLWKVAATKGATQDRPATTNATH